MGEIKKTVRVKKLKATVDVVEDKEDGEVVGRHMVTKVTIEYSGSPSQIEGVLWALQEDCIVEATFSSPQSVSVEMLSNEGEPMAARA